MRTPDAPGSPGGERPRRRRCRFSLSSTRLLMSHRPRFADRVRRRPVDCRAGPAGRRAPHPAAWALPRRGRRPLAARQTRRMTTPSAPSRAGDTRSLPAAIQAAIGAAEDKKATDIVVHGPARGGGVHRLLRDLLRAEPAAGEGDRRAHRGDAAKRAHQAGARSRDTGAPNGCCSTTSISSCTSSTAKRGSSTRSTGCGAARRGSCRRSTAAAPGRLHDAMNVRGRALTAPAPGRRRPAGHSRGAPVRRLRSSPRRALVGPRVRLLLGHGPRDAAPICDICGDPLPGWRNISRELCVCPRCRRAARPVSRSRAVGPYDGSLRGDRPCLQVRRAPVAGAPAGGAHAGPGRRRARRGRLRDPGAAPLAAPALAGLQPGGRPRLAPRSSCVPRAPARARDLPAGRPARRPAAP